MHYWLMKSEPSTYSIDTLLAKPQKTDYWDGVRNYQARNFMREMKKKDLVFFYHSNCETPGIVGKMEIVEEATPDILAFDFNSPYYDPKSTRENPRWSRVKVKGLKKFKHELSLTSLKAQPGLHEMPLTQRGSRLSVMPVQKKEWDLILRLLEEDK